MLHRSNKIKYRIVMQECMAIFILLKYVLTLNCISDIVRLWKLYYKTNTVEVQNDFI